PLLRSDFPPETLEALADGRRLSLDGQGLVRVPRVGRLEVDAAYDPSVLASVATVKLSEEEARVVADGPVDRASAAGLGVPEVLLTLGSHGAVVFAGGDETFVPAAWPVLDVQTTGAGDAFMVGYATARADGADAVEAARYASRLVAGLLEERKATVPRCEAVRRCRRRSRTPRSRAGARGARGRRSRPRLAPPACRPAARSRRRRTARRRDPAPARAHRRRTRSSARGPRRPPTCAPARDQIL